nr:Gag-protease polyprotein [Tanacetum cinerariifolium]
MNVKVHVDTIMKDCHDVWVVTASCRSGDVVSRLCHSSKKYVWKFLRTLHPKRRATVTTIEESKDITSLSLDELIENLKTFQRCRDDKNGKNDRKYFRCSDPNHVIGECPKPPKDKNKRVFVGGSWSDNGEEEDDEKVQNETCIVAQASSEVRGFGSLLEAGTKADTKHDIEPTYR